MMKRLLIITALLFGALVAFGQKNVSDKKMRQHRKQP